MGFEAVQVDTAPIHESFVGVFEPMVGSINKQLAGVWEEAQTANERCTRLDNELELTQKKLSEEAAKLAVAQDSILDLQQRDAAKQKELERLQLVLDTKTTMEEVREWVTPEMDAREVWKQAAVTARAVTPEGVKLAREQLEQQVGLWVTETTAAGKKASAEIKALESELARAEKELDKRVTKTESEIQRVEEEMLEQATQVEEQLDAVQAKQVECADAIERLESTKAERAEVAALQGAIDSLREECAENLRQEILALQDRLVKLMRQEVEASMDATKKEIEKAMLDYQRKASISTNWRAATGAVKVEQLKAAMEEKADRSDFYGVKAITDQILDALARVQANATPKQKLEELRVALEQLRKAIDLKADLDLLNAAVDGKASAQELDKLGRDMESMMKRLTKELSKPKRGTKAAAGNGTTALTTKCLLCGVHRDSDPSVTQMRPGALRKDSSTQPTGASLAPERYRQASLHSDATTYGEESLAELELLESGQMSDSFYAEEDLMTAPSPFSRPRGTSAAEISFPESQQRPGSAPPPRNAVPRPGGVRARPRSATIDRTVRIGGPDTRVYNESTRDQRSRTANGRPMSASTRPSSASSGRSSPMSRVSEPGRSSPTTEHRLPTVGELSSAPSQRLYKQAPPPTQSPADIHRIMQARVGKH